ncbi:hypothetical protein [Frondihabitans australicus]|uniref:DUF1345 domain-containing protein n=1 Tax=Frondihabitans australicus TaxID=386892 RepID=A0A495INC1_9MICO|nr:hypothetical protein [Frondihabitans australicus]RKR76691.1 hypothetical protein C8E83_3868 [Frondihabitans australicus]
MSLPDRRAPAEHPAWPVLAYAVALALFAALPVELAPLARAAVLFALVAVGIPLVLLNPRRLERETRWSRVLARGAVLVLAAANLAAMGLVSWLLLATTGAGAGRLFLAALQIAVIHVLAFGLVYWDVDRDGPVARRLHGRWPGRPDFLFSRDIDHSGYRPEGSRAAARRTWMPAYLDYLRLALSTLLLLPGGTTPASPRAKALTIVEAFTFFALAGVVVVRAIALAL